MKAVQLLLNRLREKSEEGSKVYQLALILHNRSRNKIDFNHILEMVKHA